MLGDVRQLREWIEDSLYRCRIDAEEVLRRAQLADQYLAAVEQVDGQWELDEQHYLGFSSHREQLPHIIDAILDLMPVRGESAPDGTSPEALYVANASAQYRESLREMLESGDSPYRLSPDGRGLVTVA